MLSIRVRHAIAWHIASLLDCMQPTVFSPHVLGIEPYARIGALFSRLPPNQLSAKRICFASDIN